LKGIDTENPLTVDDPPQPDKQDDRCATHSKPYSAFSIYLTSSGSSPSTTTGTPTSSRIRGSAN